MGAWLGQFFVNAPLLFGTLATAVPIVIHLVYRKRAPRIEFGALRFIRMAAERTSRRRRVQEWLLLLLRAAAIFLLAFALAGPVLRSARLGGGSDAAVAIVMDNSYSMAAEFEGRSRYARAQEHAIRILRGLGQGGQAAVVNAWPAGEDFGKEILTADRNRLADRIAASEVSLVAGDLAAAVTRAEKLLESARVRSRELYILTDLQKATWRQLPARTTTRGPEIVLIDCGAGAQHNLAVAAVRVVATRPAAGVPVILRASLRNMGDAPETVTVALYIDGERKAERPVDVGTSGTAEVDFRHAFETAGTHTGLVAIDAEDAVGLDNSRTFCVEIPERIRVAVVREEVGALPLLDEAFFVIPALNPTGGGASPIEPVPMLREALPGEDLSKYVALFLLNIPEFTPDQAATVSDYVRNGGSVIVFLGDRVDAAKWNESWASALDDDGLLPGRLGKLLASENISEPVTLAEVNDEHPVFAALGRMPERFYNRVRIDRYFDIQVEHGSRGHVLARLNDGRPFLVEKPLGQGRALLFCTAATAEWSNLPSRTLYLPLLHQMTYYLARSRSVSADYEPGSAVRFLPVRGKAPEVDVARPDGTVARASVEEGGVTAEYDKTTVAGIYTWRNLTDGGQGAFVVNPDARESDLEAWAHEELAENLMGGRRLHFAKDGEAALEVTRRLREGTSLAGPILFVVVFLVLSECFLANRKPSAPSTSHRHPAAAAGMPTG